MMMMIKSIILKTAICCSLITMGFLADGIVSSGMFINEAQARIGRPLTPGSVAGVARRTTRRTIRRTSMYVATLPRGCQTVVVNGTTLHQCGGTYYQPSGNQYVVVNVD